jgi:hypothetical protein
MLVPSSLQTSKQTQKPLTQQLISPHFFVPSAL